MVSIFRKYQKSSMTIFAIVSCFALIGFFNGPSSCTRERMPHASDDFGKIYGAPVTKTLLLREVRKARVAIKLNLDLFGSLVGRASSENEAFNNFAFNSVVLNHEADKLQIEPMGENVHTDEAVAEAIKSLPVFQVKGTGQFDPAAYNTFVNDFLPSLGFSAADLEEVVAEDLRVKKIKALLKTTFAFSPDEFRAQYALEYQKADASVIHFNMEEIASKVPVTDDEIKKAFEQHLEGYKSEEKRSVKFVTFSLSADEKKLTGKDHIEALQKLSNTVQDFSNALQEKDAKFDDVAAKFKVPVTAVPPFAPSAPDPKIPQDTAFLQAVFQATKESPVTEPVQDETGSAYYIAQLQEIVPVKLLNLAEARPQIIDQLKHFKAQEEIVAKAKEARTKIQADLTAGKSFADAAKAAGQKVDVYTPFSFAEPDLEKEDAHEIMRATLGMKEGDLSEFVPTEAGGVLIHLDKREPIDPKKFEADRVRLEPIFDGKKLDVVFGEWLRKQHDAANILIDVPGGNGTPVPPPK